MRVEYANPAVRTISGYELEEMADPAAWASRIVPEDLPRLREMAARRPCRPGRSRRVPLPRQGRLAQDGLRPGPAALAGRRRHRRHHA